MSPTRWIGEYNAIGILAKTGRGGGTFAHRDIAFEFTSWVSAEFKLYLITEFERLKAKEQEQIGWSAKRELAKINYRIHTDAIQRNLVPPTLTRAQMSVVYASEADVLNVALFGSCGIPHPPCLPHNAPPLSERGRPARIPINSPPAGRTSSWPPPMPKTAENPSFSRNCKCRFPPQASPTSFRGGAPSNRTLLSCKAHFSLAPTAPSVAFSLQTAARAGGGSNQLKPHGNNTAETNHQ